MPEKRININADMGEGFGVYDIGDDAALLNIVASANLACGFHAGDPTVMRRVLEAAAAKGVSVGAHPSFDDLRGFGRRQIGMSAVELENLVAYQIGAAMGMSAYAGRPISHVKAHGALNNMAWSDHAYAEAVARAVKTVDASLIHLVMPGSVLEAASRALGLRVALEAFVDRAYQPDGQLAPRGRPGAVLTDSAEAAARAVRMVEAQCVFTPEGDAVSAEIHSLCVHGDEPTAVAVARAARAALETAGWRIAPLPEVVQ